MNTYSKQGFYTQRQQGWGMDLYRNRSESWIAGVCAGLADYWHVPNWMIRVAAVVLFFVSGTLAFWGYIAAIFLMSTRPMGGTATDEVEVEVEVTETVTTYGPKRRGSASDRLRRAEERLDAAMARMDRMNPKG